MPFEFDSNEPIRDRDYMVIATSLVNHKSVIFDNLTFDELMDLAENNSRVYRIENILVC